MRHGACVRRDLAVDRVFDLLAALNNGEMMQMKWRERPIKERLARRCEVSDNNIYPALQQDIEDALDEIKRLEGIISDKGPSGFERPFTEARSGMGIPKH